MHDHHYLWPMFWGLFALIIILSRRYTRHRERMKALEMTERFAQRGEAPPEILAQALAPEARPPCSPQRDLRLGAVLLAVAGALLIMGLIVSSAETGRIGLHPLFGAAAFPGLIGVVFIAFGLFGRGRD